MQVRSLTLAQQQAAELMPTGQNNSGERWGLPLTPCNALTPSQAVWAPFELALWCHLKPPQRPRSGLLPAGCFAQNECAAGVVECVVP